MVPLQLSVLHLLSANLLLLLSGPSGKWRPMRRIHCPFRNSDTYSAIRGRLAVACWAKQLHRHYNVCRSIQSWVCLFAAIFLSVPLTPPPPPPSLFMSARFTSFSLSVCLQSNSQMIIHLAAFDSSRQTQGLRSSTRGQINTFSPLFLLLSSLHFQSLLSYYTECYVYFNLHPC